MVYQIVVVTPSEYDCLLLYMIFSEVVELFKIGIDTSPLHLMLYFAYPCHALFPLSYITCLFPPHALSSPYVSPFHMSFPSQCPLISLYFPFPHAHSLPMTSHLPIFPLSSCLFPPHALSSPYISPFLMPFLPTHVLSSPYISPYPMPFPPYALSSRYVSLFLMPFPSICHLISLCFHPFHALFSLLHSHFSYLLHHYSFLSESNMILVATGKL